MFLSYVVYTGLNNPNEVLTKIAEYVESRGYTIVKQLSDDLNIYDMSSSDGKRFVFMDRTETYFINMRSANGVNIFGTTDDAAMDIATPDIDYRYYGIGMTVSEGYSGTQRWYNQYGVPVNLRGNKVQCTYIPINPRDGSGLDEKSNANKYTLYCNNITEPSDTLIFSVIAENVGGDNFVGHDIRAVHMVVGNINKFDDWEGGLFFSASSVPSLMKDAYLLFDKSTASTAFYDANDSGILPILSSGTISNTFLRIDIDDAPKDSRGNIWWASSGTDNVTGKPLSFPVRVGAGNGDIPHYKYMQSTSALDWGRNINTLNCITLNMPLFAAVRVDPDTLDNYASVGQISGIYFVCMLNMQTGRVYEMSYPQSNDQCQVFAHGMRRGRYGFDGISIRQLEDDSSV